ncbi:MMPL family transporter [Cupriavidus plantarum]|uniref:Putative exporter n=1 Tax=Cupriavidus plantarum TaxID=942865 RepID=A0A316EYH6_9BURK|nr:MMPL family transporter [Cupriavidus plantarum]PWK37431.1 putative exporter [Cupriavidus plantarum]
MSKQTYPARGHAKDAGAHASAPLSPVAKALAVLWLLLVLALGWHQASFWREGRVDTDIMALLPSSERTATADRVLRQLAEDVSREVVVLVGAPDWQAARHAADGIRAVTGEHPALLKPVDKLGTFDVDAALAFYRPWRDRLLTDTQRAQLTHADPDALSRQALARLYQLSSGSALTGWSADPLGLWQDWWLARADVTRVRERDGLASFSADGMQWILLTYRIGKPAFSVGGDTDYSELLAAAEARARRDHPGVRVISAGIPLHAEAAAARASLEINVIGFGSLAAVLLLVWLAFRSLRPIVLVALSLAIGTAAAISVTAIVFDRVHLITLVFGASLVGVAEDYGIHYFVTRQANGQRTPASTMRLLLPGMALALSTSVVAYLALGVAPFPGLRQMALFSAVGLVAAFLTVVLWFPLLDRGRLRPTRMSEWLARGLARWPRAGWDRRTFVLGALLALFVAGGVWRVRVVDDVRQLQNSPSHLVEAQRTVGRLLGSPSPTQFLLVRGATPDQVLEREEAVKARLQPLIAQGRLDGVIALSDWVPSAGRQRADAALTGPLEEEVRERVAKALRTARVTVPSGAAAPADVLTLSAWLASPVSSALRHLWLGREGHAAGPYASVVLLRGLADPAAAQAVERAVMGVSNASDGPSDGPVAATASAAEAAGASGAAANAAAAPVPGVAGVAGVEYADRIADLTGLLHHYRVLMSWLLLAGAVAVAALLAWRYGRASWRALVPTLLAGLCSVALLGWLHVPLQLFPVLALALLLGVGVDYGIFLLEHPGDGVSWTAIVLGAASTLLAFGLLALSSTPALHAFGITMLAGVGAVWALSPWFRP